jgi:TatD DNase family protein
MIVDTHCHLNFNDFKDDHLEVAKRALKNNVNIIVVGSELKTSQRAVRLAASFDEGVYCSIGLHPIHLSNVLAENNDDNGSYQFRGRGETFEEKSYQELIDNNKKIVAIGETGLDYYHIKADSKKEEDLVKKNQKEIFLRHLFLAKKNKLPVIIHCREAHKDLYDILKKFKDENSISKHWAVVHCFSGDYDMAKKYFDLGIKISFTGLITFVRQWDEVILKSPLENIFVETDSPYLSPEPYRGGRNEPLYVKEVLKKIAEIKKIPMKEVEDVVFNSSREFFNLN